MKGVVKWLWSNLVEILLVVCISVIVVVLFIKIIAPEDQTTTASLRSDEWECSKREDRMRSYMLLVGKVMIPQTYVESVCTEYKRVGN